MRWLERIKMIENESGAIGAVDSSSEVTEVIEEVKALETEAPENKPDGEVERKRPSGFRRKINKLEQQLAEANARLAKLSEPQGAQEPHIDDFESFDAYNVALVQHKVNQAIAERDKRAREEQEQQKFISQQEQVKSAWEQKEEALGDLYEEYEDLVAQHSNTPFRQELIQATFESDLGPQIRHYLLKNPEELAKVNKSPAELSAYAIFKKVAELEEKLSKPTVKVSKSPEPITPVKGTSRTVVKLDNLDTDSYIAQRYPGLYRR